MILEGQIGFSRVYCSQWLVDNAYNISRNMVLCLLWHLGLKELMQMLETVKVRFSLQVSTQGERKLLHTSVPLSS